MAAALGSPAEESSQPLEVLMLSHYFEERRGGIELVAAALARELGALGFPTVWLACGKGASALPYPLRGRELPAWSHAERWLGIPYPVLRPAAWREVFRAAQDAQVILVHDALYTTSIAACLAARWHRKPLVVVQHIGFVSYRNPLLRSLMRLANRLIALPVLRCADHVIFISDAIMRYFASVVSAERSSLVFNGVDTRTFSPPDREDVQCERQGLNLPPNVPIALFVGRFVDKKGLSVLKCLARARPDILFACAGQGERDPVQWGLPNVRVFRSLAGPSLAALYRASDLLLLPSVGEGFPLVVQEALACGLPVVCGTDSAEADPCAHSLLRPVAVDLSDPEGTARRFLSELDYLLAAPTEDSARRKRFEFAAQRYSWAKSAAEYGRILRHSVAKVRSGRQFLEVE